MKRVKSLFINRFSLQNDGNKPKQSVLYDILISHPYNDNEGYGFRNVSYDESLLSASYIKRTPSFIQEYDEGSTELVRRSVYLFSSIEFSVDLAMELILVEGGASQMNALRTVFRNVFSISYDIDTVNISPLTIYDKLKSNSIKFDIKHLTISSFNFENGIVGRFSGEVIKQSIVQDILQNYASEIAKMSFLISLDDEVLLTLQVFPNGSLKYLSSEEDSTYLVSYIKTLFFS